ncbi:MAG: hypothetical protein ACJ74J_18165 [Blastocatellia bacterium]
MSRIAVATALVSLLVGSGAMFWGKDKVQAMSIQVQVKDLPEEGVEIIAPSDPSFDLRAASFLKGPDAFIDRVKSFSVIVENTGQRAIVGSRLVWEVVKFDGTIYRHYVGSANPRIFLGGDQTIQTTLGAAIPPHSTRFISLVGAAAEGEQVDLDTIELTFQGSQDELKQFKQSLNQGDREEAFNKSFIAKLRTEATSIAVSIDGVFFEDGTFVGENKTGLFEEVKAYVDAEFDLVAEISAAQKLGRTPEEVIGQVTGFLMTTPPTETDSPLSDNQAVKREQRSRRSSFASAESSTDAYQKYKTLAARTLLRKKENRGAKETIKEALELLKKPRVQLRRK